MQLIISNATKIEISQADLEIVSAEDPPTSSCYLNISTGSDRLKDALLMKIASKNSAIDLQKILPMVKILS